MKVSSTLVTLAACLHHHLRCTRAAPARTTDEVLLGEVDISVRDDADDSNEVTIKPFEKKCMVDGKTYSHAQAVSYDANSRCICVAGNVYCFWHGLLPPSTNDPSHQEDKIEEKNVDPSLPTESAWRNSSLLTETVDESPPPALTLGDDLTDVYKNIEREKFGDNDDEINENDDRDNDSEESTESTTATTLRNYMPTTIITCVVLDRTYRVGEVLPHNTGNCVECSCGPEGHVVCAPRDCVSIVPHRDYREQESFQIPVAGDLRGIDENF